MCLRAKVSTTQIYLSLVHYAVEFEGVVEYMKPKIELCVHVHESCNWLALMCVLLSRFVLLELEHKTKQQANHKKP